ncbi:MAG TPA: pitrilysin family protein [Longimicrobiales bacterium]|nr:pitrilysin family protein [Longimicrobiales bacterium]
MSSPSHFGMRRLPMLLLAILPAACASGTTPESPAPNPPTATADAAATTPPSVVTEPIVSVEGITEYRLPNGLRVLLFPDQSKAQTTVNVTYLVGSRHEGYGETGMAHLLEHLVFKGTPRHPNIPQELTERGARPNGTTWFDRTNYFETFPATVENLEWALDLEADRMVNSFISAEDLASEMTVVRNEFEAGENSPFGVLMKRTLAAAFPTHGYGHSTIGARSDIENVPIDRLRAFYRRYYQPDNAMLVVAGRFDPDTALRLVRETFGRIPRPDRTSDPVFPTYTSEPTQDGERLVRLERVGDVQVAMNVYHIPPGSHEDYAAIDVLAEVLGDNPSGRLYRNLVETRKAASTGAWSFQLREAGPLLLFAEVRQDRSLDDASSAMVATIHELLTTEPVTEEEVERARTSLLRDIELTFNSTERIALQLTEWASMGDWRLFFLHRDRLEQVTRDDVQRVAQAYLKPSNRTVGLFIPTAQPDRAQIPTAPDVDALVGDYRGREDVAVGEEFDPSPDNIEARTRRLTLPTGFEVALLPKETRGETVVATIRLRYGSLEGLTGRADAAGLAGAMLMRGTTSRTRQQIQDELDRLSARVSLSGGVTGAFASIETTRGNLPAVLDLVGEVFREPAFDATEWELLREERLAALEEQRSEPNALAFRAIQRHLNPWPEDHPLYAETVVEEIAGIEAASLDEARAFYRDFYGADAGSMSIVGDFDVDAVLPIVEATFGDWRSQRPYQRIVTNYREIPAEDIQIETPDKANAWFVGGMNLRLPDSDPDYPALLLGNYMLGGGFLNSRLATRIRQNEGLSYGVGSFISGDPLDDDGGFMAYAIYAPENRDRLEQAFREEIDRMLRDGFTAEEVEAALEGYLQSRQMSRAQDMSLSRDLEQKLYLDRDMTWDSSLEERIRALTPDRIVEAMRRHIDPSMITVVKAGDFSPPEEEPAT